jgi:hypothetical protein
MDEQIAYLCTLQVATSSYGLRVKHAHEAVATWLGNRLTVTHPDNSHLTTFSVTNELLNGQFFWIRLLKSPIFKVRVLIDPKCPVLQIAYIRLYVNIHTLSQTYKSLSMLLDEDLLETCLTRYTC